MDIQFSSTNINRAITTQEVSTVKELKEKIAGFEMLFGVKPTILFYSHSLCGAKECLFDSKISKLLNGAKTIKLTQKYIEVEGVQLKIEEPLMVEFRTLDLACI